jgi:hypothetical protein
MVAMVGLVSVLFVNVSAPAKVAKVPVVGKVTLVAAVLVKVVACAPLTVRDAFAGIFNELPEPAVISRLFILVAVATPSEGVVKEGLTNGARVLVPEGNVTLVVPVEIIVVAKAPVVDNEEPDAKERLTVLSGIAICILFNLPPKEISDATYKRLFIKTSPVKEGDCKVANVPLVGRVTLVVPTDVRVVEYAPAVKSLEELANVNVLDVVGVIVTPFMLVAVATPNDGVVKDGLTRGAREADDEGKV